MAYYLPPEVEFFPHPLLAGEEGFLAMGSSLTPERLLLAYTFGIFPWSNAGEPLCWFFTDPRCILYPDQLRITKSMRPYLNGDRFSWSIDRDFRAVIASCKSTIRKGQGGTWIHQELEEAFVALHEAGHAHSVEVWEGDELVGGLYGLAIGKIFFGESMFAKVSNCLLYTSPSPRDRQKSRMPSSA